MREAVAAATELVAEIGLRFKAGDAADDLLARLESILANLTRQATGPAQQLPDDLRAEIARLLSLVQTGVATGAEWLAQTGPELASLRVRQRLQRAYGIPDSHGRLTTWLSPPQT